MARKCDSRKYDCLVVAISTHGRKEVEKIYDGSCEGIDSYVEFDTLWAHDGMFTLESLVKIFNEKNCPGLADKPKIFIIQVS